MNINKPFAPDFADLDLTGYAVSELDKSVPLGVRNLMLAVLYRAYFDLLHIEKDFDRNVNIKIESAREFFFSKSITDRKYLFSFKNICKTLDLPHDDILAEVERKYLIKLQTRQKADEPRRRFRPTNS